MEEKSNLQLAIETPIEELTEEQKTLIQENVEALDDEQKARYSEAGIIEVPQADSTDSQEEEEKTEGDDTAAAGTEQ